MLIYYVWLRCMHCALTFFCFVRKWRDKDDQSKPINYAFQLSENSMIIFIIVTAAYHENI